jgi:dephospho-CoA kinase
LARSTLSLSKSIQTGRPLSIGLTGGPGVGKSTVAKFMRETGANVIDADAIGHWLLAKSPTVIKNTVKLFGNAVLGSKGLDRSLIGAIVFSDDSALGAFNRIVHPPLLRQLKKEMSRASANKKSGITVVDAALIFEWGIADWFDLIVVVDASRASRIERLRRVGLTLVEVRNRFASQLDQNDKVALADHVIKNDGNRGSLKKKVRKFMAQIARLA